MNFGESLKLLRKKHNMSANELSRVSGVNRRTIGYIENRGDNPSWSTAQLLLEPLGARLGIVELEPRSYKHERTTQL